LSASPRLVELEDRLWQDADGSVKRALVAELDEVRARIHARLASGGSQDDFAVWTAEARAVTAALEVLEQVQLAPPAQAPAGPAQSIKGET
jgi:type III secretion system YseE family protein